MSERPSRHCNRESRFVPVSYTSLSTYLIVNTWATRSQKNELTFSDSMTRMASAPTMFSRNHLRSQAVSSGQATTYSSLSVSHSLISKRNILTSSSGLSSSSGITSGPRFRVTTTLRRESDLKCDATTVSLSLAELRGEVDDRGVALVSDMMVGL